MMLCIGIGMALCNTSFFHSHWSDRYCYQLNWLKAGFNEKHSELAIQKSVILNRDNAKPDRNWYNLARMSCYTYHTHLILHLQIIINFDPYKNISIGRTLTFWNACKINYKDSKFWEDGIMRLPQRWQKLVENNE